MNGRGTGERLHGSSAKKYESEWLKLVGIAGYDRYEHWLHKPSIETTVPGTANCVSEGNTDVCLYGTSILGDMLIAAKDTPPWKALATAIETIKVLVVDDHAIVREAVRAFLTLQKDIQVVGEAVNGQEALERTLELAPDVVLMDIAMPVMNGLEATERIRSKWDQAKILMLTQYDEDENVLASTQVGALGFVPKRSVGADLLNGIRSVSQGKRFVHSVAA